MQTRQTKPSPLWQNAASSRPVRSLRCPDRRSVLQGFGHAGLAALLAPGASLLRSDRAEAAGEPLIQPTEIRSRNGELSVTLTATPSPMRLGNIEFQGFLYNDAYMPPLLRLRLGDVLRVRLKNNLPDGFTNLHFHGLSVSPRAEATMSSSTWRRVASSTTR
jgi:FtsP/CotA-like multicopper oxidase with cupredoxin domain